MVGALELWSSGGLWCAFPRFPGSIHGAADPFETVCIRLYPFESVCIRLNRQEARTWQEV